MEFATIVKLTESKRSDATDPGAVAFDEFLGKLGDGENVEEDWNTLWENSVCSLWAWKQPS